MLSFVSIDAPPAEDDTTDTVPFAIEAVNVLTDKYLKAGKKLHLYHLSHDCRRLLKNAEKVVEVNVNEDPVYEIADDKLDS